MADRPQLTGRQRNLTLVVITAVVAIYGVTSGLVTPLLSLLLDARGEGAVAIGATAAASAVGVLLFSPLIPRCIAACGTVGFIALCLLVDAVLIVAFRLFDDVAAWIAIRVVMGMSLAGLFTASETWISEVAAEHSRGRVMGIYNAVLSGSFAVGPLLIGLTGIDGWTPFLVAIAFVVLAALPLPLVVRYAPLVQHDSGVRMLGILREAPTLVLGVLLVATLYGAMWALVPIYGVRLALTTADAAMLLTVVAVGGVVLQFPIGWLGDVVDRYVVMIGCALVSALAALCLPLLGDMPWLLWLALFVWGGSFSAIYTMAMTIGGQRYRGAALAMLMAAFGVMWGGGLFVGPLLAGWAMDSIGPRGLPLFLFAMAALFVVFATWRRLRTVRRVPAG